MTLRRGKPRFPIAIVLAVGIGLEVLGRGVELVEERDQGLGRGLDAGAKGENLAALLGTGVHRMVQPLGAGVERHGALLSADAGARHGLVWSDA